MGVLRSESRPTHSERMTAGLRDEPIAPEVGLEYTEPQSCGFLLKASLEGTLPPPKHLMETSGMFLQMDFSSTSCRRISAPVSSWVAEVFLSVVPLPPALCSLNTEVDAPAPPSLMLPKHRGESTEDSFAAECWGQELGERMSNMSGLCRQDLRCG